MEFDNFGLVNDPSNFVHTARHGEELKDTNMRLVHDRLMPYVKHIHIKDMNADGKQVLPGEGVGEIEYMLGEIYKKRPDGKIFVTMEPHLGQANQNDGVTPFEKYKEAVNAMRTIIRRVYGGGRA